MSPFPSQHCIYWIARRLVFRRFGYDQTAAAGDSQTHAAGALLTLDEISAGDTRPCSCLFGVVHIQCIACLEVRRDPCVPAHQVARQDVKIQLGQQADIVQLVTEFVKLLAQVLG